MSHPNSLNCTQFQAHTLERLERNGVDLQSLAVRQLLEMAVELDQQASLVYSRLLLLQRETERRIHRLMNEDGMNDDAALHLGDDMNGFSQEAVRVEMASAEMKLGRKMLKMATQGLLDQLNLARAATTQG